MFKSFNLKSILLYRGTRDGFVKKIFNENCLNKGATLTIIKSDQNKIFGGYTTLSWEYDKKKEDIYAFVFSLTH
jgi:hypothetical protein